MASDIVLMPHHKRTIVERVLAQGLAYDDLEFTTERTSTQMRNHLVPKLIHRPTGYYFKFDGSSETQFHDVYSPNTDTTEFQFRHVSLDERFRNVAMSRKGMPSKNALATFASMGVKLNFCARIWAARSVSGGVTKRTR